MKSPLDTMKKTPYQIWTATKRHEITSKRKSQKWRSRKNVHEKEPNISLGKHPSLIRIYSNQSWSATKRHGITSKRKNQTRKACKKSDEKKPSRFL